MNLGVQLRQARLARKLTISDVAAASGLSRPYISQVETGKAAPSLASLEKLATALHLSLSSLFDGRPDGFTRKFISKNDRQVLVFGSPDGPSEERKLIHFYSAAGRDMEFCMLELAPGYIAGDENHHHDGEEVFLVHKGTVRVTHGDESYVLKEGDSIHVNAKIIHQIANIGSRKAEVMVARTPAGFADIRIARSETDRGAVKDA